MTYENIKPADNGNVEIEQVVANLTRIVEKETSAFQLLLDALLDQQSSILKGDTESVTVNNEKVEQIMEETRLLENKMRREAQILTRQFETDGNEALSLTDIIPLVERRYADRLIELREVLNILMQKIQATNQRNRYLLANSLHFVDNCMKLLVENQSRSIAYSKYGTLDKNEKSIFSGTG